jgi:outer membrane protein TolC
MKHKIIISIIFLISALTPGQQLWSQERVLNLKEAVQLSLDNSKQLKASTAKIDAAISQVKEAEQRRLPDFSVSSSYIRLSNPNIDLKTKSNSGTTGGSSSSPKVSQALYGIANISYPLYAGGRLRYGIESAKYLEEAARLDAENDKEAVVINAINAYINLYKATSAIDVVKESLASSRQRDTTFSRLEQNGLLARNDLLKSQLQTSGLELTLLDAESNRNLANINMDLMLGLPENTKLIIDTLSFIQSLAVNNIDQYEQLALQSRKDLMALAFRKKAAGTLSKSAKAEAYPSIALTGGYIAADIPNFMTITNAVNIGIGIQYNLSSLWKTNTKLQQAKAKERELLANEGQLTDVIRMEVNTEYQNYLLSGKRIDVYQKALQQATENYRIVKNKYDNSLANVTELLEADVALTQAKLNLSVSRADAMLAYNRLLHSTGLLNNQ